MPYRLDVALGALRLPHKLAQTMLLRDIRTWVRVEFLGAAADAGVLAALAEPRTEDQLAERLGVVDRELLRSLLELGDAVGERRRDGERWRLRGRRARALANPALDGMAGMLEESITYDADVYGRLRRRLHGEPPGNYLEEAAELVARASRLSEFLLGPFVRDHVRRTRPTRVLDVGCGSAVYLRAVASASPSATGAGVDIKADVVAAARRNLVAWGIADRFNVHQADLRALPEELAGPWDLVFLFQNIYYFAPDERAGVLSELRLLAPTGILVVATIIAESRNPLAAHLDVVLRSTQGNYGLPTPASIHQSLRDAGFSTVAERQLAPLQPMRAFVAS